MSLNYSVLHVMNCLRGLIWFASAFWLAFAFWKCLAIFRDLSSFVAAAMFSPSNLMSPTCIVEWRNSFYWVVKMHGIRGNLMHTSLTIHIDRWRNPTEVIHAHLPSTSRAYLHKRESPSFTATEWILVEVRVFIALKIDQYSILQSHIHQTWLRVTYPCSEDRT